MSIQKGLTKGSELQNSNFFKEVFDCKRLDIIDGDFDFFKFLALEKNGMKIKKFEKINLLLSAGKNLLLLDLFENFKTYSTEEKKDILEEAFFSNITELEDSFVEEIYNKILQGTLEIKLGFTKNNEAYINDEIIFGNKYAIISSIDKEEVFKGHEYYHVLIKKEIKPYQKNFDYKFENSYPFKNGEEVLKGKELLESNSTLELDKVFNFNNFIMEIFDVRLRNNSIVNNNPFILDDVEYAEEIKEPDIIDSKNTLRDYQEEAIDQLIKEDFNGKLQMATGTGKTYTTLYGLKEYLNNKKSITNITLIVPLKLLVDQWESEIKNVFGSKDFFESDEFEIYKCFSDEKEWKQKIEQSVGFKKNSKYNFIIFVDDSFEKYIKSDSQIDILREKNSMLIVDEAHNLQKKTLELLSKKDIFSSYLALSATLYDDKDMKKNELLDTVFSGVDFTYSIDKAIEKGYLCEYEYIPKIVDLDSEEIVKYKDIRRKINILKEEHSFGEEYLNLKKEEASLISKAHKKVEVFEKDLEELQEKHSILVYSNRGNYGEEKYIDYISKLTENKLNVTTAQIIGGTTKRDEIIKKYKEKEIEVIVGIKCLDEGVDIPSIKRAFLLYSGGKSKEFVQRRGRILRRHEDKKIAYIHDYIVRVDGEIPKREKNRFKEYVSVAKNKEKLENFLGDIDEK